MERYSFYEHETDQDRRESTRSMKLDRLSGIDLDADTAYWFAKQRWLWRRGKLEPSKVQFIQCLGDILDGVVRVLSLDSGLHREFHGDYEDSLGLLVCNY